MDTQTIIFIGPQGSGKGTQAHTLGEYLKTKDSKNTVVDLQTGRNFRHLMEGENYTAKCIKGLLDEGQIIPDFVAEVVVFDDLNERLTATSHLTMDGFPRNLKQVKFIDDLMKFYKRDKLSVIYLNTPDEVVLERLKERGRFDDTEELIKERLNYYKQNTEPIIEEYRSRTDVNFVEVDGSMGVDEVQLAIKEGLKI